MKNSMNETMQENSRAMMENQKKMQMQMREMQMAVGIAKARDMFRVLILSPPYISATINKSHSQFYSSFAATVVTLGGIAAVKRKNPVTLIPALPLTWFDLYYSLIHRYDH